MIGFVVETIVMAFVVGCLVGAITALQLNRNASKIPVKIQRDYSRHQLRIR